MLTHGQALFGPRSDGEVRLLDEAAAAYPDVRYEGCTRELLAGIAREHGVDFATAFFVDRIRRAPGNSGLIAALEDPTADGCTGFASGRVLIVPALFYRERRETGGDGAVVEQAARAAGLSVELVPVKSGATARENAILLRRLLPDLAKDATVVVSLSKGAADLRLAFEGMPVPPQVRAWVIVSGLLRPTPAIDRLQSRWWSRLALGALLRLQGGSPALPREFESGGTSSLGGPASAPDRLPVINLVGCPLSHHLGTRFGRRRHRQMSVLGPNDGLTLLRDAILEPGATYPVWGADHYFRLPAVPTLLTRLIAYLCTVGCFQTASPMTRSAPHRRAR
jgi:hypothetical protein